jgi:hypothetical protein
MFRYRTECPERHSDVSHLAPKPTEPHSHSSATLSDGHWLCQQLSVDLQSNPIDGQESNRLKSDSNVDTFTEGDPDYGYD